jgi:two-component system, LytTR family, sensor kinase
MLLFIFPHFFIDTRNLSPSFLPGSFFIITNIYNVGLFYLNVFVLYPLFFNKRKWWIYILAIGTILACSYYLKLLMVKTWYPQVILDKWTYRILFFPPVPFLIVGIIYRLVTDNIKREKKQKEIVAEQLSVKLKFLRSQISPHFIFNVLTNLVSLARKKSDLLEPALLKLSDLMRYMLYESDENKVELATEVEYLKSYIDLQKLRFGNDILINTKINIPEKDFSARIEPMLLIPFVENAFKHGTGVDNPAIEINLNVEEGKLKFDVRNKFSDNETKDESSGIGLENVRSRLLLLYPKDHELIVTKENNLFHIHLTLQLK